MADRYFAAQADKADERSRMLAMSAVHDRTTQRRIGALGPLAGQVCLEVGAGAGLIAQWLADQVGPSGRVVATDIDIEVCREVQRPGLQVLRHDLATDPLPAAEFDLVHARALLLHLADPRAAVAKLVASLRPGGWLIVEDLDNVSVTAICADAERARRFDEINQRIKRWLRDERIFDAFFGRTLPTLLAQCDLVDCGNEANTRVLSGGELGARLLEQTDCRMRDRLLAAGVVSAGDLELRRDALLDPDFRLIDTLVVAAWGRRVS